jgi:hypothetical protein
MVAITRQSAEKEPDFSVSLREGRERFSYIRGEDVSDLCQYF